MSKLRSDAIWNELTPGQREQMEEWLLEKNLSFRETHERAQKELGLTCCLTTIRRMYALMLELRAVEEKKREEEQGELDDSRSPLHPVRVYRELGEVLDRDAIVVGDGGDFVSYAGRFIDTYEPGCWMDPGPFGCLGAGPGQAIGAKVAHPDRQVCLLLGDGAFGFAGIEFDTMARHGLGVVGVMGNNGIWALEHHPMKFLYGYSIAAELRPETRYDQMVESLGCDGILVREPGE